MNLIRQLPRPSLSTRIIIGFILGLLCGLVFGEMCHGLHIVGVIFIKLLQMTVLPYVVVSLIHGIASLSSSEARMMATRGGLLLLSFWAIGVGIIIFLMPLAFPHLETASFYSTSQVIETKPIDLLDTYIPSNPFRAMSQNMVPAVVFFSVCLGIAIIGIKNKERFLDDLSVLSKALTRVAGAMVQMAPVGVFALTASAAGTITVEELSRLQVYFVSYVAVALMMAFWLLPALVSSLTPFTYRDALRFSKDAMVLSFVTASAFVALPVIAENAKALFKQYQSESEDTDSLVGVLVPVTFSFPSLGRLLPLLFVVFTAWFYQQRLDIIQHFNLAVAGVLSLFGSPQVAIPFLLDQMRLPSDTFHLHIVAEVLTERLDTLVTAASLTAFTIMCTGLIVNLPRPPTRRVLANLGITVAVLGGSILLLRYGLESTVRNTYRGEEIITSMQIRDAVPATVYRTGQEHMPDEPGLASAQGDILSRITARGILRVGYRADAMPFSYFNKDGELVGYDIAFAHRLADSLGCSLEFVLATPTTIFQDLEANRYDILMSAESITPERLSYLDFTQPYMTLHAGFVVPDYLRHRFKSADEIRGIEGLRIAIEEGSVYTDEIRRTFPNAEIVPLHSAAAFFEADVADALFASAEEGSTWTLLHPSYAVVSPDPPVHSDFLVAYAVANGNTDFLGYLNHWLTLAEQQGISGEEYAYWILGKDAGEHQPRWSVIRDVLQWVP